MSSVAPLQEEVESLKREKCSPLPSSEIAESQSYDRKDDLGEERWANELELILRVRRMEELGQKEIKTGVRKDKRAYRPIDREQGVVPVLDKLSV